jgi:hypothetical protein
MCRQLHHNSGRLSGGVTADYVLQLKGSANDEPKVSTRAARHPERHPVSRQATPANVSTNPPKTPPANSRPQGTSRGDLVARPVRRGVHYMNGRCVGDPVMLGDVRKDVGGSDATGYGGSTP